MTIFYKFNAGDNKNMANLLIVHEKGNDIATNPKMIPQNQ
jgi:hypothetical protein